MFGQELGGCFVDAPRPGEDHFVDLHVGSFTVSVCVYTMYASKLSRFP